MEKISLFVLILFVCVVSPSSFADKVQVSLFLNPPVVRSSIVTRSEYNAQIIAWGTGGGIARLVASIPEAHRNNGYSQKLKQLFQQKHSERLTTIAEQLSTKLNQHGDFFNVNALTHVSAKKYVGRMGLSRAKLREDGHHIVFVIDETLSLANKFQPEPDVRTNIYYKISTLDTKNKNEKLSLKLSYTDSFNIGLSRFLEDQGYIEKVISDSTERLSEEMYLKALKKSFLYRVGKSNGFEDVFPDYKNILKDTVRQYRFTRKTASNWRSKKNDYFIVKSYPVKYKGALLLESQLAMDFLLPSFGVKSKEPSNENVYNFLIEQLGDQWKENKVEPYVSQVEGYNTYVFEHVETTEQNILYVKVDEQFVIIHKIKSWANHELFFKHHSKALIAMINSVLYRKK